MISSDRTAWAIEADNGRARWQIDGVDDVNNRIGSTAPAVSDKFALFGFGSGEVQAVFRKAGWLLELLPEGRARRTGRRRRC